MLVFGAILVFTTLIGRYMPMDTGSILMLAILLTGQEYHAARFGEIRINTNGDAVLIGLRSAEGERLGSALH
jgi:hypothetical protein